MRRCSGWIPSPTARRREIAAGIETLDAALEAAGRDPGEVRVRIGVPPPKEGDGGVERSMERLGEVRELGATDFYAPLSHLCPDPDQAPAFIASLASAFRTATA